jgi:hypothetical protein
MTRVFFGKKSGSPVMKIMRNDADSPLTTPNTAYGKFAFNSETGAYGYITEVTNIDVAWSEIPFPGSTGTLIKYFPTGVSATSPIQIYSQRGNALYITIMLNENYSGYEDLKKAIKFFRVFQMPAGIAPGANAAQRKINADNSQAWARILDFERSGLNGSNVYWETEYWIREEIIWKYSYTTAPSASDLAFRVQLFVTDMPGNNVAYLPTTTPVAGQKILKFSKTTARLARPGYDVDVHASDKMIFAEDRVPMKIAGTGFISNLAAGATTTLPVTSLPVSKSALVIGMWNRVGQVLVYPPMSAVETDVDAIQYRFVEVSGVTRVQIKNGSLNAVDLRYAIMTDDAEPVTSGSSQVIEQGANYVRIIRPGAGASPSSRDVLIDSRSVAMPLVAQGWIGVAGFQASDNTILGTHMVTINHANDGSWKPYVMMCSEMTHLTDGTKRYNLPLMHWAKWLNPDGATGDTVCATLTDTQTKIYFYKGDPDVGIGISRLASGAYTSILYNTTGIRYYIFALPI